MVEIGGDKAHKASHQNGGSDEINVAGLSGDLADAQDPKAHKASHQNGGSDEIDCSGLAGIPKLVTGTYTGDGAGSHPTGGQSISGLGFTPVFLMIWRDSRDTPFIAIKPASTRYSLRYDESVPEFRVDNADKWFTFDVDGFTVFDGDGDYDPNDSGVDYYYFAIGD